MDKWYVYIVRCVDDTLYTGVTKDVNRRVLEHNGSKLGAKYTKKRQPVKLEAFWEFDDKSIAYKEEYRVKKLSREVKLSLINLFKAWY